MQRRHAYLCRCVQSKSCRMGVCTNESARTELDAAEVADDGDGSIRDAARFDRLQDGTACRTAWLAVVARTLSFAACTEYHCIGNVTRFKMLFLYPQQPCTCLILVFRMDHIGEKA